MQKRTGGIYVGLLNDGYPSYTFALSNAAYWMAYGFNFDAAANKTLNKIQTYVSAYSGTSTVTADLVGLSSSGGVDYGNILDSASAAISIAGTGVFEWTGFDYGCTPGQQYFILFKNTSADPTTAYPTLRYPSGGISTKVGGSHGGYSFSKASTQNSGSTWSTSPNCACLRCEFSDGSLIGLPFHQVYSTPACYGQGQYQTGVQFKTPSNATLNVIGVIMGLYRANSPTGDLKAVLRYGSTTVESITIPASKCFFSGHMAQFYFTSVQSIPPGTDVIVTLKNTATDSSVLYYSPIGLSVFNDSASKGMLPFADGVNTFWQQAYTNNNGISWTYDSTMAPAIALILDSAGEFGQINQGRRYRR